MAYGWFRANGLQMDSYFVISSLSQEHQSHLSICITMWPLRVTWYLDGATHNLTAVRSDTQPTHHVINGRSAALVWSYTIHEINCIINLFWVISGFLSFYNIWLIVNCPLHFLLYMHYKPKQSIVTPSLQYFTTFPQILTSSLFKEMHV